MIIDTTSLAAEIDRFVASVDKLVEVLQNDQSAVIADLQAQLAQAAADDATNVANFADQTARLKAANDAVDAALNPPAPVEETPVE